MWEDAESIIRSQLSSDETLLWSGRPKGGICLRAVDGFLIPFGIIWTGFAALWMVGVAASGAPLVVAALAIPFLLIGIYLPVGRFVLDAKRREKTSYGLTNNRIVIVSGIFSRKIKSLNLRTLTDVSLTEKGDRSGSITFGPTNPMFAWFGGAGGWWPGMESFTPPSFEMIQNAREVYEKIVAAQKLAS